MLDIPCVIFAGGKSSRMGEDKSLLPFAGFGTLTQFQFSRLSKIFKTVYISCKDKNKFDFQANYIEDIKIEDIKNDSIYAPTAGFVTIFKELQDEKFFALSVDSPFIDRDIIEKLLKEDTPQNDATIAKTPFGIQPLCGIYHRSLENSFGAMLQEQNHKLGYLLKSVKTHYVFFTNDEAFLNLNHPHEYQEAIKRISV